VAPQIRDARAADSPAIAELLRQLDYPTEPSAVTSRLERLAIVGDRVVVAEVDGHVVGVAHLHASPTLERERPAAKIGALVVDKEHRGRGIGRALLAALETEARARRCSLVFLTTAERREGAQEFYERVGFRESGKRFARDLEDQTPSE
jgi:N-acetylglutamate synthase-like GNAT family acetyltransferase